MFVVAGHCCVKCFVCWRNTTDRRPLASSVKQALSGDTLDFYVTRGVLYFWRYRGANIFAAWYSEYLSLGDQCELVNFSGGFRDFHTKWHNY